MLDRWEGIVRTFFSGSSCPARIMASLLVSPHSRTLQQPSKNAILFMGDCVRDSGNPTVERLSRLETVSSILLSKLEDSLANIWVVDAPKFDGPFAFYEGFLSSMSSHGEPLSYDPHNFSSSRAATSILHSCLTQVRTQLAQMSKDHRTKQADESQEEHREDAMCSTPKTVLFGFSKGGVVLNQLLCEMAYVAKHGQDVIDMSQNEEWRIKTQEGCTQGRPPEQSLCPTTGHDFLASIVEAHFLDVGLNCHGAYLTDSSILKNVVKAADASSSGLLLGFHGTPRQWMDPQRPWIAAEKDFCIKCLRTKAQEQGTAKLAVCERLYFEHRMPSLQMHFEILECFEINRPFTHLL